MTEHGLPPKVANRIYSQIRKGAPLHADWTQAFVTERFYQRRGKEESGKPSSVKPVAQNTSCEMLPQPANFMSGVPLLHPRTHHGFQRHGAQLHSMGIVTNPLEAHPSLPQAASVQMNSSGVCPTVYQQGANSCLDCASSCPLKDVQDVPLPFGVGAKVDVSIQAPCSSSPSVLVNPNINLEGVRRNCSAALFSGPSVDSATPSCSRLDGGESCAADWNSSVGSKPLILPPSVVSAIPLMAQSSSSSSSSSSSVPLFFSSSDFFQQVLQATAVVQRGDMLQSASFVDNRLPPLPPQQQEHNTEHSSAPWNQLLMTPVQTFPEGACKVVPKCHTDQDQSADTSNRRVQESILSLQSSKKTEIVQSTVRRIIAAFPIGGNRLMSGAIM